MAALVRKIPSVDEYVALGKLWRLSVSISHTNESRLAQLCRGDVLASHMSHAHLAKRLLISC